MENGGQNNPVRGWWRRIRQSCGNIAKGLNVAGCCLVPLMWSAPSCDVNHAVAGVVGCLTLISFVLACVAGRFWVVLGAVGLNLLMAASLCA